MIFVYDVSFLENVIILLSNTIYARRRTLCVLYLYLAFVTKIYKKKLSNKVNKCNFWNEDQDVKVKHEEKKNQSNRENKHQQIQSRK